MAWEQLKQNLLAKLRQRIDQRSDEGHRESLHNLGAAFYTRFPAEDMRQRSAENLYGCLYGLLRFLNHWEGDEPKVRIFNPDIESHGWESKYTTLVILCRDMPFCTASVRGELNRRNVHVHTLTSCNISCQRDAAGELLAVQEQQTEKALKSGASAESLLYFEISRHSDLDALSELRATLAEILGEVSAVVTDFPAMREQLRAVQSTVESSECIDAAWREEAAEFLRWLEHNHMTFLGYEYLAVSREGGQLAVTVDSDASLGALRHRATRGVQDLEADLAGMDDEDLRHRQLSFSKSRLRSRVHRLAYPDYVEIKVFDEAGAVVGQHRFIGLYTSSVYTMDPKTIPILRRKVQRVIELSQLDMTEHDGRELVRVLELFPRDELFQSSIQELFATASAVNRIQERRHTRLFVRKDAHGKFVNCLVYLPRDTYNTEIRVVLQDILTTAFEAEESEFTTLFSESILVRCHFVLRVDPARSVAFDVNEIEEQIVQATLAWEDRLRNLLVEEFGEEQGEQLSRELGAGFPPGYRDDFDPRVGVLDIRNIQRLIAGEELTMSLYRLLEEGDDMLRLRLYHRGESLPLSDVLPILENLGLRVVAERPYGVRAAGGDVFWIQEFSLIYSLSHDIDLDQVKDEFEDAFARIWFGEAESDCFNRLLIGTRLNWREIALLRAYARYLKQVNFPYSVDYIAETMANHLHIAAGIVELFLTRFSPVFDGDEAWREQRESAVEERILD
jgi:glutamate dehydrogenase